MTKSNLTLFLLVFYFCSFGQNGKLSEKEILLAQRTTTAKVIVGLQNNKIQEILPYFGKEVSDNLIEKLQSVSTEIEKVKDFTTLTDMVIFDEGCHIYRCSYSDQTRSRLQIDLYFQINNPQSKVVNLKMKTDRILKEEYRRRMNNRVIPPPPPTQNGG